MIVAGFGFRASATAQSFADAMHRATVGQAVASPTAAATLDEKADGGAFARFARDQGLRLIAISSQAARAQDTLTRSVASLASHGVGSVAEASALAAAGPGARLLGPRAVSADGCATCALARKAAP